MFFDGRFIETLVFDYDRLMPDHRVEGPSIIEMKHSCCVVAPDWEATVDEYRNLQLEKLR